MTFGDTVDGWSDHPNAYPDMTPGPPADPPPPPQKPATYLDKAWTATPGVPQEDAPQRIRAAISAAWEDAPPVLTPEALDWSERNIPLAGKWLINPAARIGSGIIGGVAAGTAGAASTLSELGREAGLPAPLLRDLTLGAGAIPAELQATGFKGTPEATAAASRVIPVPGTDAYITNPMARPIVAQPRDVPPSIMPTYMQPIVEARQAERERLAQLGAAVDNLRPGAPLSAEAQAATRPSQPPPPISSPTGIAPPIGSNAAPPPPQPRSNIFQTKTPFGPEQAADTAAQLYRQNATVGGDRVMDPSITNSVIDKLKEAQPAPGLAAAVGGPDNVASTMYNRAMDMGLRDQPQTLAQLQSTYKELGDAVSKEYGPDGLSERGRALWNIQRDLRDQIAPPDLQPTDPWSQARLAWSQSMKMDDLQRIQDRAMLSQSPQTAVQNQLKNMITNDKRMRGYTPEEQEALRTASENGYFSNVARTLSSRLIPIGVGAATAGAAGLLLGPAEGIMGATAGAMAGEAIREPMAATLRNIQMAKLQRAMGVLNQRVPPPPQTGWTVPPSAPAP